MKANILIVDDSPTSVEFFKRALEEENHKVLVSYDGKNIPDIAIKYKVDIILLDIIMPETSGFEILNQLQSIELTKEIPVIMITKITSVESLKDAFDRGALDYIRKPFEPIELIARINAALSIVKRRQICLMCPEMRSKQLEA